jgi:hypothetical protein
MLWRSPIRPKLGDLLPGRTDLLISRGISVSRTLIALIVSVPDSRNSDLSMTAQSAVVRSSHCVTLTFRGNAVAKGQSLLHNVFRALTDS